LRVRRGMSGSRAICERCGEPANIHITSERTGAMGMRHLCLRCVEIEPAVRQRRKRAFNAGAAVMCIGAMVLFISLFADQLAFGQSQGFGQWQIFGVLMAAALVGVGAVMRIPTLMVVGLSEGCLSSLADWLDFGSSPGFGRSQWAGSILGGVLIGVGLVIVMMRKSWATARAEKQASRAAADRR
jgi:hypothetical protein